MVKVEVSSPVFDSQSKRRVKLIKTLNIVIYDDCFLDKLTASKRKSRVFCIQPLKRKSLVTVSVSMIENSHCYRPEKHASIKQCRTSSEVDEVFILLPSSQNVK